MTDPESYAPEQVPVSQPNANQSSPLSPVNKIQADGEFELKVKQYQLERIKTWISALGLVATVFAGVGLFLTYQNSKAEREFNTNKFENEQHLSNERLITDRFSKAVEQLGSKDISVRLGGIYALERIASDSPKDHWIVMEVLMAYVREYSKVPEGWIDKVPDKREELPAVAADSRSALIVIGRRKTENDLHAQRLDLHGSNLKEFFFADPTKANIQNADFYQANLQNAFLPGIHFRDVNLNRTYLQGAFLGNADLTSVQGLTREQLKETYLCKTKLPNSFKDLADRNCNETSYEWYKRWHKQPVK